MPRTHNTASKFIEKYGQLLSIERENSKISFRAFFQPLRYKNKMYLSVIQTELGYDVLTKFLLICPAYVPLEEVNGLNVFLRSGNEDFNVDHCEKIYFRDEPLYYWAIVHQNKGEII